MKTVIEFCSSLKGEHMCRLGLYPWTNARDPAVWVSLSLHFSPALIHSKNLCVVTLFLQQL